MSMKKMAIGLLLGGALATGALACLPPGAPGADVPHKHASASGPAKKAAAKRAKAAPAKLAPAAPAAAQGAAPAQ